ncbi:tripartite tricarboxylate transporter substrate binding protein [Variovorax paradoxus]|uniref:Bug family tripartite tricarboxylate transporter substrate binding protein n=1 Tax=Variovorax paradoxus TaxID=34073 RepID=UPI0019313E11|nr:tripartite tricarboxylate transporter substrate binding protein [Variovorax paradoxus]
MPLFQRLLLPFAVLLFAFAPTAGAADTFPEKPMRLFVTFGPGSGPDTLARAIAPKIAEVLGQSVVIENRPAANGNVAAQQMLQAAHDGYTLLLATDSLFTVNPYLLPKTSYDIFGDLALIAPVAEASMFLVVHPSLGVTTFRELINLVKANPGKYAYFAPTGAPHHLLSERLTEIYGLDWVRVSYRDPQQALTEMIGGLVPIGFASYAQIASSVSSGQLKALGVSTSSRLDSHASVPALNETVPGLEEVGWYAIYAPTGTPKPVIEKLAQAVVKARDSAEVKQRLDQFGMRLVTADPAAFSARVQAENQRRGRLIKERGIRID